MQNIIDTLSNITTSKFASFTYKSKSDGGVARYTLVLGISYINLLESSKLELEIRLAANEFTGIDLTAAKEVLASINKSLEAHKNGTQNDDYTKKGQYTNIGGGVNVNNEDNSFQVFGLVQSKVVLIPGTKKNVKSAPLTIAKNNIRKLLPISKFREFAFDFGNIKIVKANGETTEIVETTESYEFAPDINAVVA
jgi:hypothetical protein